MLTTVTVWLLINVSAYGNLTVVAKFDTAADCQFVKDQSPSSNNKTRCIQARIVKGT